MPAGKHPSFTPPPDPGVQIWRYMDFTKFAAMLEKSGLFFVRASVFEDPFEASYPKANESLVRQPMIAELRSAAPGMSDEQIAKILTEASEFRRWVRQWILVNSWHMNEHESAAMWRLYARSNEAVALRSTYQRLAGVLDDRTYVGTVTYLDYERDPLPENNIVNAVVSKRLSFQHERELRAVSMRVPTSEAKLDMTRRASDAGEWVTVELPALIERIHVAPAAPDWYLELVSATVRRFGLATPVQRSSLDASPFF